jgi:hypothetical protein
MCTDPSKYCVINILCYQEEQANMGRLATRFINRPNSDDRPDKYICITNRIQPMPFITRMYLAE